MTRRSLKRLPLIALSAAALAVLVLAAARGPRETLLRRAGHALVSDDPLTRADIIVIATDADGAGVLEAADLVKAGVAPRIALFPDPPDATDLEFLRRGVPYFNAAAVARQQLKDLGVNAVEEIPQTVRGTEDEGPALRAWITAGGWKNVVFISTKDHSRRTRRVMDRALQGVNATVLVRGSRYSDFDPDAWWHSRAGTRIEAVELEKLLLDVLRHPFS
ncbi:MAG TPA: hypothetical protein VLX90_22980 [Steroidobacteraceae bacterium]|nr:hypothetical protein [Steroidobacteraceae bacterium]